MLATEWGMGNVLWTMFALLIWCMAIWIFIDCPRGHLPTKATSVVERKPCGSC